MKNEKLVVGSQAWERACSIYVRFQVFVLERSIHLEDEFDSHDQEGRVYANLLIGEEPVSTGRFLPIGSGRARLTRIATLASHRGKGYARSIIMTLEDYAREVGIHHLDIHSELMAKTFYESLGYVASSELYQEDGEWCQTLSKRLDND